MVRLRGGWALVFRVVVIACKGIELDFIGSGLVNVT